MKKGFTLIELLVVIAIIAILAAILFPVFGKARAKAHQTSCTSNQRQIAASLLMYAQDHEETMPPADTWTTLVSDPGVMNCNAQSGDGPDYCYNGGSHLAGQSIGSYNNPVEVLVTGDAASPAITSLVGADGGSGTADLCVSGNYDKQVSTYFGTGRHNNGIVISFLDGHVAFQKTDSVLDMTKLKTYINNGRGASEPVSTEFISNKYTTSPQNLVAPSSTIYGAGWFNVSSVVTLLKTPAKPGFDIIFPAAGGASVNRVSNLNMQAAGISNTDRRCQICTAGVVRANLMMDFADGKSGLVHISWGSWTDNSEGGAELTVIDNTSGQTFNGLTNKELSYILGYNTSWTYNDTVFKVGMSKSLTVEVRDTRSAGRSWLQAIWVEPAP